MNELDQKINTHIPGLVVRTDLVKTVKGNAIVASYVLEYLLGQYCVTSDEPTIQTGIETVKEILAKSGVKNGMLTIYSHHTTCSVMIQECSHDKTYFGLEYLQQDLCN